MDDRRIYQPTLKRVGVVLVLLSLVEFACKIHFMLPKLFTVSIASLVPLTAGIFLIRGNLRAALRVRWMSVLPAIILPVFLIHLVLQQPIGLSITEFRLNYSDCQIKVFDALATLIVGLWVFRELGREPVQSGISYEALNQTSGSLPFQAALGVVGIAIAAIAGSKWLQTVNVRHKAEMLAAQQVGSGYEFHAYVTKLVWKSHIKYVWAIVTAWNSSDIRHIRVDWHEP